MSGIVALWRPDGAHVDGATLATLSATLAHRGEDADVWTDGPIGLACRLRGVTPDAPDDRQPAVTERAAVVFDGRLDNRDVLVPALGVDPDAPDVALILAAYETVGAGFVERLVGDFALALFDRRRRRLFLARDAVGIRPLYYLRLPGLVVAASEIKALLAHPRATRAVDDDYLAAYLAGRLRPFDHRTFFAGVRSVPPASVLTLSGTDATSRRYWDFDPAASPPARSFPECAEAFREVFGVAVRRRLRSRHPVAVSVSGGLDSSSIFSVARSLAASARVEVFGITYVSPPGAPSDEVSFVEALEERHGVTIDRIPVLPVDVLATSRDLVRHVEVPLLDEQGTTTASLLGAVRRRGARVVLTGHWGDQVMFDQAYLVDCARRLSWRRVWRDLHEYGHWFVDARRRDFVRNFLRDVVRDSLPARALPVLRALRRRHVPRWYGARLRRRGRRRPHGAPTPAFRSAHARSLYEQIRSGSHVACMEWNNKLGAMHGVDLAFPFLDRDLLAFLLAVPGELVTWQGVPKALLRTGLQDVLPPAVADRRWKADFTDLVNEGMRREAPAIARLVAADGVGAALGYIDADRVERELAALSSAVGGESAEPAWRLGDLLALELWLQEHIAPRGATPPTPVEPRAAVSAERGLP